VVLRALAIYLAPVSSAFLSPDEIRAAAETHTELGADYQPAVIESFLDKVGREIDARVEARLRGLQPGHQERSAPPAVRPSRGSPFTLAVISLLAGIPLSAIALSYDHPDSRGLVVIWLAITVINVGYTLHYRSSNRH